MRREPEEMMRDLTYQIKKLRETIDEGLKAFALDLATIAGEHAAEVTSAVSRGFSDLGRAHKENEDRAHADRQKILETIYKHGKKTL